ncbi:MAG TPA: sigma-54 dependent transcriptional regulator [Longimicrobiales bacterium]
MISDPTSLVDGASVAADALASGLPPEGIRVLIVDDEFSLRESCANILRADGYNVSTAGRGDEALDLLRRRGFDLVLIDLYMSQVSGMELLRACLESAPETLVIVMTGDATVEASVEVVKAGAWQFLPKPFTAGHLQLLAGRARHVLASRRDGHRDLEETGLESAENSEHVTVLGVSPAFRRVIELARKVADTDVSVLIHGESGTGKEQIAQFIHHHSRRRNQPLIAINCAALPEPLLESEMFGHVRGSFTGAVQDKPGLLEAAHHGTLFLDEITEMSQAIQAKLLRVIQDGAVRRVGSNSINSTVDVRFIAATNRNPQQATDEGVLRRDLYYRLRVVPIRMPALRERPEDIPVLARHFLARYWTRHREPGSPIPRFSAAAIQALQSRSWPGNVRELQNVIEHAVVLLQAGAELQPADLPSMDDAAGGARILTSAPETHSPDEPYHTARERMLAEFERAYLMWLVRRASGNMSEAARIAGVDRTTLYRLMEKHSFRRGTIITEA